jgi:hypothetical protein
MIKAPGIVYQAVPKAPPKKKTGQAAPKSKPQPKTKTSTPTDPQP